jgi:glycosyltransferase involved in cell wall biosynthesis
VKIAHWTLKNGSGLHKVATEISAAEVASGLDSVTISNTDPSEWELAEGATIHCVHSHLPEKFRKGTKTVFFIHGTPEHIFQTSVEAGLTQYAASDSFMMAMEWIRSAHATVTFWPRHAEIWRQMSDRNTRIECLPMGINTEFWKPVESLGKWAGNPSLLTAENCHYIKWPLDLFIAWPWVASQFTEATLHAHYLPRDQHRWFMPLVYRNGAAYRSYISADVMNSEALRNALCSVDYYVNLVRYGDFNRIGLEAAACGCKVISYEGNEFAHYWITEGDQRRVAEQLRAILGGLVEPREITSIPSITSTVARLKEIYGSL